jgi:integrase
MSFRSGQSGTVVRKGQMWHGRYYVDDANSGERHRVSVALGSVREMKKTEAKRKLRSLIESLGLNADKHIEHTVAGAVTFASEAQWWRENRLPTSKPSTQEAMGSHLDKYLLPRFGSLMMSAVTEKRVQELIADMTRMEHKWPNGVTRKISPKTIRNVIGVLQLIVGEKVWKEWKLSLPEIPVREQRYFSTDEMRRIVETAKGQWKVMFALLAGSGMRAGELFGLHVDDLDLDSGRVFIRRSVWNGEEVTVKSKRGYRVVNIEPAMCAMLKGHLNGRTAGRVFQTSRGTPYCKSNVRRKLLSMLTKLGLPGAGLHAFRHGRVSVLQACGVPADLVREWVGHSSLRTTSRYTHFADDFRKRVAANVGLFGEVRVASQLPVGPNGPKFAAVAGSAGGM